MNYIMVENIKKLMGGGGKSPLLIANLVDFKAVTFGRVVA